MKKIMRLFVVSCSLYTIHYTLFTAAANAAEWDVEDPLYFARARDLALTGGLRLGDSILGADLRAAYGVNDLFVIGGNVKLQYDFDRDRKYDGFSHIGVDVMYRMSEGPIIADAFMGVKFSGNAEPAFSDTIYMTGFRIGHQWSWVTLAGLLKTSWIFDEAHGMAWINLVPEAYFKLGEGWRIGTWFDFQKATSPHFDEETIGFKLVRQYGRTQYVGFVSYGFEQQDWRVGGRVNIVF
ncbi:MAG: hypothetical protein FWF97_00635 [Alphaproteobacteria bacterium]|nr:hypothetical protein [Alphaproteobacteria bacterium]